MTTTQSNTDGTSSTKQSRLTRLKQLLGYGKPYRWRFAGAFLVLTIATGLEMLSPWVMKIILDEHIAVNTSGTIPHEVIMLSGTLMAIFASAAFLQYIQNLIFQTTALRIVHDIRRLVFRHVLKLPMRYFDSEPTGRLVSRITNDSEVLRQMFVSTMPMIMQAFFRLVAIFIAMALLDVRLMLMTMLLIPILLAAISIYQKVSHPIVHAVRSQLANINVRINESLGGMRIIQAMRQEAHLQQKFNEENEQWSIQRRKSINIDSLLLMPLTHLLNGIALAVVVGWFGFRAGFSVIEVGTLYAFIYYLSRFFEPFRQITMQMSSLQQSLVASERVFEILNEEVEQAHTEAHMNSASVQKVAGKLEFKNVTLSYDGKNKALDNVSFSVEPGAFVAIVGQSGSGKSSIINLMMRFYQYGEGQVLVDDQPLECLSEETLRNGLGLVFQEPYIFSGSMAENISLNHSDISDADVIAAAKKVHADSFVESLDGGYSHEPGSSGKALSMGERQLLSFARTIAQNPGILLLDEATANIDGETEHLIKEALITLRENRTTIAVAHRLSTIQDADMILVMDKGQIVQRGGHAELLAVDGIYRNLYLSQQSEATLEHELESDSNLVTV